MVMIAALLYLVWTNKEGFTSGKTPKDTSTKIQASNTALTDNLNVVTYRSSYESMIQDLEKWADNSMLTLLAEGKIGVETSKDGIKQFNELAVFKKNIKEFMDVLHKME